MDRGPLEGSDPVQDQSGPIGPPLSDRTVWQHYFPLGINNRSISTAIFPFHAKTKHLSGLSMHRGELDLQAVLIQM